MKPKKGDIEIKLSTHFDQIETHCRNMSGNLCWRSAIH